MPSAALAFGGSRFYRKAHVCKAGRKTELERLLDKFEPKVRRTFLEIVRDIKDDLTLAEITEALESGRIVEAMQRATDYARLGDAVVEANVAGAEQTAAELRELDNSISFDRTGARYGDTITDQRLQLITGVALQQREAIAEVLIAGLRADDPPAKIARGIRESIGLTGPQESAARRFEEALEDMSPKALRRELDARDRKTIRRAIREGKALTQKQIDNMVARYRRRALKLRAETIARTEVLRALHEGQEEMLRQVIDAQKIDAGTLVRTWRTAADSKVRSSHRFMDGQDRALGEVFTTGNNFLLAYPGDPDGPASETINCRCTLTFAAKPPQPIVRP